MLNFNNVNSRFNILSADHLLGRLVRVPLRLLPPTTLMPILQGPAKGLRWIVGSYNHGCWLGSYEIEKQRAMMALLARGDTAFDIGAHRGFFTLVMSQIVGSEGFVVSFEPDKVNYTYLTRHIELNRLSNVRLVNAGVAGQPMMKKIAGDHSAKLRKVDGDGDALFVELTSYMRDQSLPMPNLIKMDIEGDEVEVLPAMATLLASHRVKLVVSTHGQAATICVARTLEAAGYRVTPIQWSTQPRKRNLETATAVTAVI